MRRWVVLILVALLALGGMTTAQSVDDLNGLAQYYPTDTLFFGSVRTDGAFVDELDVLLQQALNFLPPEAAPPITVPQLLDMAAVQSGTTYTQIRSWLGDRAAVGVLINSENIEADPFVLVAADVEGAGALAFVQSALAEGITAGLFESEQSGDYTVFSSSDPGDPMYIAVGSNVLFVASTPELLPLADGGDSLADNPDFAAALSLLPEDRYSMTLYVNSAQVQELMFAGMEMSGVEVPGFLTQIMGAMQAQVMGMTIKDGNTLIMDWSQSVDVDAMGDFSILTYDAGAVDLSFDNRVPADAALVIQSSDFGPTMQAAYAQVRALGDWLDANGGLAALIEMTGESVTPEEAAVINEADPAMLLGLLNFIYAGGTGLSLEREVFPVLDGDMALYLRLLAVDDFFMSPVVPDLGMLFQTSDNDGAMNIIQSLTSAAEAYNLNFPTEDYGTGQALAAPLMEQIMGYPYPNLDVMVGASDGVVAFGTRPAVQTALQTAGGLADDPTFQAASKHFLPDAQMFWYLNIYPLLDLIPVGLAGVGMPLTNDIADGYRAASILKSTSVSAVADDSGKTTFRFALSLANEPQELPANQQ